MAGCSWGFLPTLVFTLTLIRSLHTVQGFECHVGMETTSLTDGNTQSVIITWNCTLKSNVSVLNVLWSKDGTCIAKSIEGVFIPCETYVGRVEMSGTYGISLHNISRNDSGHYQIIILDGNITECLRCPPIYMLVLTEQHHKENAQPMDGGLSRVNIGLICGLVSVTVIGLALGLLCFLRGSRAWQTRNKTTYPDQTEMLQSPIRNE